MSIVGEGARPITKSDQHTEVLNFRSPMYIQFMYLPFHMKCLSPCISVFIPLCFRICFPSPLVKYNRDCLSVGRDPLKVIGRLHEKLFIQFC